ncbi:DUF5693 family protein [Virgibacillus necropolis]|uniref:DUF5693 family protein n=1 Tax=Virgibacillus necropolis TaxID=163877 RepID=UPI00384FFB2D
MIKRQWLWIIIALLLLISLPGLHDRWQTEVNNNTYEIATPYQEILSLTTESPITTDEALSSLKEAGLNTVSLKPMTLDIWEHLDIITIYGKEELETALMFSNIEEDYKQKQDGFYTTIPKEPFYVKKIKEKLDPIEVTINNQSLYFFPDKEGSLRHSNLGYNRNAIQKIKKHDLNYLLRVENADNTTDDTTKKSVIKKQTIETLVDLKDEDVSNLLFSGSEVIGYPNLQKVKAYSGKLQEAGYNFYTIEFFNQKGLQTIAKETNYNTIRLHSFGLGNETFEEGVDRAVRAIKERNIRTIFFHFPNPKLVESVDSLENATEFISAVNKKMPDQFTSGTPEPFDKIFTPAWIKVAALMAGILFTFLASGIFNKNTIRISSIVFMFLLALSYFLLQNLLLLKAFALIIAVITPIYAVISTGKGTTNIKYITFRYLRAIGISFVGIVIVISLLNGNKFITGFELFRGVKLVYIVPILFVAIYLYWRKILSYFNVKKITSTLNRNLKYWHVLIFLLVGFVGFYYISRTGNSGTVSEFELLIRYKLEEYLYVRPRTKEFLIGFPFYILALYTMGINNKWGKFLLIPGVIGFLSIMNTFTHFHIPLNISLLRTAYSIVIGYIIGIVLIYLFKIGFRYISKAIKTRWS